MFIAKKNDALRTRFGERLDRVGTNLIRRAAMNEFKRFIDDCCVNDWCSELPVEDLDTAYRRWCWQHGEKPRSRDSVAEGLVQHGFVRARRPTGWIWGGVRLSARGH